jgi:hypothetical protein
MKGKPEVTKQAIVRPARHVQEVPALTEWRHNRLSGDAPSHGGESAGSILDGSILWPTPGVSGLEGLRLLDPEDSIFYNPARAMEELGQLGHANSTRSEAKDGT